MKTNAVQHETTQVVAGTTTKRKDSIYVEDATFRAVAQIASELGISKNAVYDRAVADYIQRLPELMQIEVDAKKVKIELLKGIRIKR